jgi:hypothetical protein
MAKPVIDQALTDLIQATKTLVDLEQACDDSRDDLQELQNERIAAAKVKVECELTLLQLIREDAENPNP